MKQIHFAVDAEREAIAAARRRSALILIGIFWAFAVLMLSLRALVVDSPPLAIIGPRRLMAAALGALMCLGMARILWALRGRAFAERILWGVAGAIVMAVSLTATTMMLNRVILPVPGWGPPDLAESAQWVIGWLGYFLAWTGIHLALTYHWDNQDHEQRAIILAATARDAQMAALRYQLTPHFLFNTLNSISSLVIDARNAEAEAMLLNLATFLRSTLTTDPAGTISLRDEIELQRLYLDIERVRFADRLDVEIVMPEAEAGARVPALILQPLVENAVRHGVGNSEEKLTIRIATAVRGDRIEISVEDDGERAATLDESGFGMGLGNVRARLGAQYGESGTLVAAPLAGRGYRAVIAFPRAAG